MAIPPDAVFVRDIFIIEGMGIGTDLQQLFGNSNALIVREPLMPLLRRAATVCKGRSLGRA